MYFVIALAIGAAFFSVTVPIALLLGYKLILPRPLSLTKPAFCFLPKYQTYVYLPEDVIDAGAPVLALGDRLAEFGFAESSQTPQAVYFTRGFLLGEFSVKIAKINLSFSLPLDEHTIMSVSYGSIPAIDTADLWTFTTELKRALEMN